jgi:hypothetical protein
MNSYSTISTSLFGEDKPDFIDIWDLDTLKCFASNAINS